MRRSGCRAGTAPSGRTRRTPDRTWWNRARPALAATQSARSVVRRSSNSSHSLLPKYGAEDDVLEPLERLRIALDLHAQHCALPGREQEVGEILGVEGPGDVAGRLTFGDAGREWLAPALENIDQSQPKRLTMNRRLKAEIAYHAAARPVMRLQLRGDDIEVPAQPADWRRAVLRQGILDQPADIGEVAFQHL